MYHFIFKTKIYNYFLVQALGRIKHGKEIYLGGARKSTDDAAQSAEISFVYYTSRFPFFPSEQQKR